MGAREELMRRFPQLAKAVAPPPVIEKPEEVPYDVVRAAYTMPFDLYQFQVEAVNDLAWRPRAGYYLDTGCVDADTEYLSTSGWVKISDYAGGEVAQYNLDGSIEFVKPTEYVKKPCPAMYHIKTKYGVDQMLSPEHRVLYKSQVSDNLKVISAEELVGRHNKLPQGFRGKFITTFTAPDHKGLALSDADLRLQVAVIADGSFDKQGKATVSLRKGRKLERLSDLIAQSNREVSVSANACNDFIRMRFEAPMCCKEFVDEFFLCSRHQLAVIADEFRYWDGSDDGVRVRFSSTSKKSADFIQYACAAAGIRSVVSERLRDEEYRSRPHTEYTVHLNSRSQYASITSSPESHHNIPLVPSTDGYKYCFSVPSTYLIFRRNGCIFASGNTGKTATSTVSALYKLMRGVDIVICLMPPILIAGWMRWLARIPEVTAVAYKGTPKQRKDINFDVNFVCMSYQIFKRDYDEINAKIGGRRIALLCDEATAIKNTDTDNHRKVYDMAAGQDIMLLTGTPLSKPEDSYAYCRFIAPHLYRSFGHWCNVHVAERDFFNNIVAYRGLDVLADNMKVNAVRVLKEDVLDDLPPITYTPLYYDLEPDHMRLYNKLVDEQLLKLEDGGKIDATTAQALYHALGQIITNYAHFSGYPKDEAAVIELLVETLEELGKGKLLVFTNYRMTNGFLQSRLTDYMVQVVYGGVSATQQQKCIDTFIQNPECRCLVLQTQAGGFGIDGLQDVCNDVLFLEIPPVPTWFHQAAARLHRGGQKHNVNVRIAVAQGTCNVRQFNNLMDKDALVNRVIRNVKDLRDALHGN